MIRQARPRENMKYTQKSSKMCIMSYRSRWISRRRKVELLVQNRTRCNKTIGSYILHYLTMNLAKLLLKLGKNPILAHHEHKISAATISFILRRHPETIERF